MPNRSYFAIVFFMRTYPEPKKHISFFVSQGAVVPINSDRPYILLTIHAFEVERGVKRIFKPEMKDFSGLFLYFGR